MKDNLIIDLNNSFKSFVNNQIVSMSGLTEKELILENSEKDKKIENLLNEINDISIFNEELKSDINIIKKSKEYTEKI
jgi:hypothetical protein